MGNLSFSHLLILLVVALLLFGSNRIAEVGKGLGEGIKNFKKGLKDDEEPAADAAKKQLAAAEPPAKLPAKTDES
jgi:sec-independent protein translocase protein TatA